MSKQKHETALTNGQLAEFVTTGTKALILIADKLGPVITNYWARNSEKMQIIFSQVLVSSLDQDIKRKSFLVPIDTGNKPIIIDAVDGSKTLVNSTDLFLVPDDSYLANQPSLATAKVSIDLYWVTKGENFKEILSLLSKDVDRLCLTQHQVVEFCSNYKSFFDGFGTYILIKDNKKILVSSIYATVNDKFVVNDSPLDDHSLCVPLKLVVPQLL